MSIRKWFFLMKASLTEYCEIYLTPLFADLSRAAAPQRICRGERLRRPRRLVGLVPLLDNLLLGVPVAPPPTQLVYINIMSSAVILNIYPYSNSWDRNPGCRLPCSPIQLLPSVMKWSNETTRRKYNKLGWDLAIARYQPRPCGQQGWLCPHLF